MSGVISVIGRPIGADDISFGQNSFVYVDVNGVPRRIGQVNAGDVPFESYAETVVQNLVDGSKNMPVGASNLGVVNTSILSGPVYGSGTTSGYIKNYASGLFAFGQSILTGDIPSGIPASNIGSGTVNDAELGYLDGVTSSVQTQINALSALVHNVARLQYFEPSKAAKLVYVGTGTAGVYASSSANPAMVCMDGFPDIKNPGQFVVVSTASALPDCLYRQVIAPTYLTLPNNLWGTRKVSQWYAVLANAAVGTAELSAFTLKGMPYLRAKSEAGQVISTGENLLPTNAIDYGFTVSEFVNGKVYVLTGSMAGELRTITANNAAAGASTISYSGGALSLANGDWFIVLPPSLNFRWICDVFNNAANVIDPDLVVPWITSDGQLIFREYNVWISTTNHINATVIAGGGAGAAAARGGNGEYFIRVPASSAVNGWYWIKVGAGGTTGLAGGSSIISNTNTTVLYALGGAEGGGGGTSTFYFSLLNSCWGVGGTAEIGGSVGYTGVVIIG